MVLISRRSCFDGGLVMRVGLTECSCEYDGDSYFFVRKGFVCVCFLSCFLFFGVEFLIGV